MTPELLRDLYEVQGLSETEIAAKNGLTQVQINRLRKKWGIATITNRAGRDLLPLTSEQREVLLGSLLGDGHLYASGKHTATYSENHSKSQEEYARWKMGVLGAYVSGDAYREKKDGEKIFPIFSFWTKSCTQLRSFYDLFYPDPDRKRVFPPNLSDLFTARVLSVWYMDDGSVSNRGEPRITFGLDSVSLSRAVKALRKLGLSPKVYDDSICFPKQAMEFRSLVEPFMHTSMHYKLPTQTPRQEGDRNARKLTPEVAKALYEGGLSAPQIGERFGVGKTTVDRRLKLAGVVKRSSGPSHREFLPEAAMKLLEQYDVSDWETLSELERSKKVDDVYNILRSLPFPYPNKIVGLDAIEEFEQLQNTEMWLEDMWIQPARRIGLKLCNGYFPNRLHVSAFDYWQSEKELKRAIRFQFKMGDPVLPHRVLRVITMNCRTPTIFRPTVAKFLYQRYCPKGGTVWDPCMGYGGRMLGALAAGVQYIGTDVEPDTLAGNQAIADLLEKKVSLHLCPAESFSPPKVDMVFTSPPYFDREKYSNRESQSWKKYSDIDSWSNGFLRPILQKSNGSTLVLNIADLKGKAPLVQITKDLAIQEGFSLVEELKMPISRVNRQIGFEPVLVFK